MPDYLADPDATLSDDREAAEEKGNGSVRSDAATFNASAAVQAVKSNTMVSALKLDAVQVERARARACALRALTPSQLIGQVVETCAVMLANASVLAEDGVIDHRLAVAVERIGCALRQLVKPAPASKSAAPERRIKTHGAPLPSRIS